VRASQDRILVSHAGVLPRPDDLRDMLASGTDEGFEARLPSAVREVVAQQIACGVDIVNDGEISKRAGFSSYAKERLSGFVERPEVDARNLRNVTARDRRLFPGPLPRAWAASIDRPRSWSPSSRFATSARTESSATSPI